MRKIKKTLCIIFVFCFTVLFIPFTALNISAADVMTETLNLLNVKKNQTGEGYSWHNPSNTLTLSGLNINTVSKYGLRILDNTVIVLQGNNIISAADTALYCAGTVTIKGTGTLTLISGNTGIVVKSEKMNDKLMILEGTIDIKAGFEAIRSDYASVSIAGGKVSLSAADSEGYAINGRVVTISGRSVVTADNTISGSYSLTVNRSDLTVNAPKPALQYGKNFDISNVTLSTGSSASSLASADAYNGETSVAAVPVKEKKATSIIFGSEYPLALDFILLAASLVILAAVVFIPPYVKKRRVLAREAAAAAQNKK